MQVKERVKDSMYALGMPITQGAITTILGVIGLGLAPSYIFVTFFKMVLLVIVLGKWSLFYLCLLIYSLILQSVHIQILIGRDNNYTYLFTFTKARFVLIYDLS